MKLTYALLDKNTLTYLQKIQYLGNGKVYEKILRRSSYWDEVD